VTALLAIDSLDVHIGDVHVIKKLSLQVQAGEVLGLVGASGSGKSMTALAVLRLLPPRARLSGSLRLRGADIGAMTDAELQAMRGRDIGMVFQEPMTALNPLMRVGDQVAETVRLHGAASRAAAHTLARETLASVGLRDDLTGDRYPHELSGGQRQRVAIAIAVVLRPALLIADEPTTALDVSTQAQVLVLLRELVRERRMGLILVSHDLAVISQVSDRVAVMQDGAVVETGASTALRQLHHPYAKALLAAAELAPKAVTPAFAVAVAVGGTAIAALSDAAVAAGAAINPILEVRGLVRDYPGRRRSLWSAPPALRAVNQVSLTLYPGENVGLVGESGSGKSSLLRSILALDPVQAGEVRLLGEAFSAARGSALRRLRRSIQAVFQDPYGSFDPQWTVARLIAEPYYLVEAAPNAAERRRRVAMVLEQVGLAPSDAARFPHEFSGGQRQRIAIARALITEPAVIVFDEAVSALDVLVRAQILSLLDDLSARLKLAYLFVSHDLNVVRAIADRVYVMQRGRIVEEGATAQVFASPQHEYTRALIAATPRIGAAPI
jgi:peptide/nickel transport system ATP-binding protein